MQKYILTLAVLFMFCTRVAAQQVPPPSKGSPPPPSPIFTKATSKVEIITRAISRMTYINSSLDFLNKTTQIISLPGNKTPSPVTIWRNENGQPVKISVASSEVEVAADEYFFSNGKLFFAEERKIKYPIAADKILFAISEDQKNNEVQSADFEAVNFRIFNTVNAALTSTKVEVKE